MLRRVSVLHQLAAVAENLGLQVNTTSNCVCAKRTQPLVSQNSKAHAVTYNCALSRYDRTRHQSIKQRKDCNGQKTELMAK